MTKNIRMFQIQWQTPHSRPGTPSAGTSCPAYPLEWLDPSHAQSTANRKAQGKSSTWGVKCKGRSEFDIEYQKLAIVKQWQQKLMLMGGQLQKKDIWNVYKSTWYGPKSRQRMLCVELHLLIREGIHDTRGLSLILNALLELWVRSIASVNIQNKHHSGGKCDFSDSDCGMATGTRLAGPSTPRCRQPRATPMPSIPTVSCTAEIA